MGRTRCALLLLISIFLVASSFVTSLTHSVSASGIRASHWIIYDVTHDAVLDSTGAHQQIPMASLTKVMTGLLVVETLSMNQQITIVRGDLVGESSIWVQPGDTYTVRTLLHGLMMRSGNDAAAALARAAGGSPHHESNTARGVFIEMMNTRATELGMQNSSFRNPHGLDEPGHFSSAHDLMLLTKEVMNHPLLMQPFGATTFRGEGFTFEHSNQLPKQYDGVLGGKTGWTNNAGLCLIQLVERDGRTLIVVLLGSTFERWYPDAIDLLDYGWSIPPPATDAARAAETFEWWRTRTDGPIELGLDVRSWFWGPEPASGVRTEPYREAVDGERLVQYFDKGRMEINDPDGLITSGWYVTGGHLARELITGNRQIGDAAFIYRGPAHVAVAGDAVSDSPTYADMAALQDTSHQASGTAISLAFTAENEVQHRARFTKHDVQLREIAASTSHGIADVFDDFLDREGIVIERGQEVDGPLFSPRYAIIGLPITEPVWMRVPVGGAPQDVLVQCFERRCLTYTPSNPGNWRVEMGNIGRHYLEWQRQS